MNKASTLSCAALALLLAAALVAVGCESDGGGAAGSETGPVGTCDADPAGHPPVSGSYSGRFAFSSSDATTFPLSLDVDLGNGTIGGSIGFQDARQSYAGTMTGTTGDDGHVSGTMRATGSGDGQVIEGTFSGTMDALGGCGSWTNQAGQGGPWQVGERAKPQATASGGGGGGGSSGGGSSGGQICTFCSGPGDCDPGETCDGECCEPLGAPAAMPAR